MFDLFKISKNFIESQFQKHGFSNKIMGIDDYQIQYWDNNKNENTLLLLHGFGAQAEFQWYKQIAVLSKDYRVIVPNLLYFGGSKPKTKQLYTLHDQAQMVESLIEFLKIDTFSILGISYGGLVSMEYYRAHKDKIEKIILIDSPVKYFNQDDLIRICKQYDVPSIIDFFAPTNYTGLRKQIAASYYLPLIIPSFITKNLYENMCFPNIEHWEKLIIDLLSKMDYYASIDYKTDCPTLLIWGEKDDIIPLKIGQQLKEYFDNSTLVVIPRTKHLPNLERPKLVNQAVLSFLSL
jgi:pimeloyl-ACP methyl ester carboxylesterase